MKRTNLLALLTILIALLALTACERPAPGSEAPPASPTPQLPAGVVPTLPPLLASPTPTPGVPVDPNAPIGASPTPTIDPALQPIQPTALPPAPEAAAPPVDQTTSTGETIHIVQPGENLYRIGLQYGFTYQELAAYNGIANPDSLSVGQQIKIPPR